MTTFTPEVVVDKGPMYPLIIEVGLKGKTVADLVFVVGREVEKKLGELSETREVGLVELFQSAKIHENRKNSFLRVEYNAIPDPEVVTVLSFDLAKPIKIKVDR